MAAGDPALPPDVALLRRHARDAYARGQLAGAAEAVAAITRHAIAATLDDFLFAGLVLNQAGRPDQAIAVLRQGVAAYPAAPALQENLAVLHLTSGDPNAAIAACHAAIAAAGDSPNIHDCLCEAYSRIGDLDRAVIAGRTALEAKDRRFGQRAPIVAPPATPPPPFNPANPAENVIAYTLWGNAPRYQVPLLENVRLWPHLFPEWTIRVYHDASVEPAYLDALAAAGVQCLPMALPPGTRQHRALLWRFAAIADPTVRRFLIRDADSLLTVKERVAVDAWLASDRHFHAMRDWYSHTDLLLAGLWGGTGGILPPPDVLLGAHDFWRMETDHIDQDILATTVWPVIRANILIHDSIFRPCLGSVGFPPYGALPPGHHVGENAFLHFTRSD